MGFDKISKALKVFYVLGIVVFCTFLVSFIFSFDACYNYLCNNLLEDLSFKNFIKINETGWGYSVFGFFTANTINVVIFILGFIVTLPILFKIMSIRVSNDVGYNIAETGLMYIAIAVLFYFPFKVVLLGLAYALTFFATNAGILVLLLWFILICIGYGILYYKLKNIADGLIYTHLGSPALTSENYDKFCPEFAKVRTKMFLVAVALFIVCALYIVARFV